MVSYIIDHRVNVFGEYISRTNISVCMYRWDPDCMDSLPDYMKTVFKFAWNTFEECENAGIMEEGLSYDVQGALEEVVYIYK